MKNTTFFKNMIVVALALMVAIAPLGAFAKNGNSGSKAKADAEVSVKAEKKSCLKAWGHLIASGWLKRQGAETRAKIRAEAGEHCRMPFGIAKKLNNDHDDDDDGDEDQDDEDTTAPAISNVSSQANATSAVIKFSTDEKASAKVFYGTTTGLDLSNSATLSVSKNRMTKDHSIKLLNLSADTKYYAVIQVKDDEGNIAASAEFSFTTKASADTTGPAISNLVAVTGSSSIAVSFSTNEPATAKVFYGSSSPVNVSSSGTSVSGSATASTSHSITVPSLSANTQYYLVVQAKDGSGNITSAAEFGAKTSQ